MTVNPAIEVDLCPLPKPLELFATLTNGKQFTKLDLSHANQGKQDWALLAGGHRVHHVDPISELFRDAGVCDQ